MSKVDYTAISCVVFCCSLFVMGLAVPTIYYGFLDEDSSCQEGTRGGIDLSDWVKGTGLSAVVLTFVVYVCTGLGIALKHEVFMYAMLFYGILDVIFYIIWWIWGVVVISTNENNSCVADGKGMAVMCIINLVIGGVRFIYIQTITGLLK